MANNAQKTPFISSINELALRKARGAIDLLGKSLPASVVAVNGSIVTVQFEISSPLLPQVTVPILTPEYIRVPTQVGDLGVVYPSSVRLGGVTGLGGGVATAQQPANLAALAWMPIANANWSATDDADAILLYGPNGFILRDVGKNCTITGNTTQITVEGKTQVQLKVGSNTITISASGIDIEGTLTINGAPYLLHQHSGVTIGTSNTGGVV